MHLFNMLAHFVAVNSLICLCLSMPTRYLGANMLIPVLSEGRDIIPGRFQGDSFTINQVKSNNFVRNGPLAYAKALKKHGVKLSDDVLAAISVKATAPVPGTAAAAHALGTVRADPTVNDREYLSPVQIGTPAQTLMLDFDTGSADLWVFSTQTLPSAVNGHGLYNPGASNTSKLLNGSSWDIHYGDGSSSSGSVYTDKVQIGKIIVPNQGVESATIVSRSFTNDNESSGLLGLGFSTINTVRPIKQLTWFENAVSSLLEPLFTANLKHDQPGNYNFGYIDHSEYSGNITYVPVDSSNGYWGYTTSGYAVGSGPMNSISMAGIADTGTSLILLPSAVVAAYYSQVLGARYSFSDVGWEFPCDAFLPDFTFQTGSYIGTIPGAYMNYVQATTTPVSTGGTCYGGIQSSAGIGFSLWGDVLLKAQFVVFDAGSRRLGFASKSL